MDKFSLKSLQPWGDVLGYIKYKAIANEIGAPGTPTGLQTQWTRTRPHTPQQCSPPHPASAPLPPRPRRLRAGQPGSAGVSSHTTPSFPTEINKLNSHGFTYRGFCLVSALPGSMPSFDANICPRKNLGPQRALDAIWLLQLGVLEGSLGSPRSEGFSSNLRATSREWLVGRGGRSEHCIEEPVNLMSSGFRVHDPPTVKWGKSGVYRLPVGPGGRGRRAWVSGDCCASYSSA